MQNDIMINQPECSYDFRLLGAMIGLARATEGNENKPDAKTHKIFLRGIYLMNPANHCDKAAVKEHILLLHEEKAALVPRCSTCKKPCGRNDDFNTKLLFAEKAETRNLKYALLAGIFSFAVLLPNPYEDQQNQALKHFESGMNFLYKAFFVLGYDYGIAETALRLLTELGDLYEKCITVENSKHKIL